MKAKSCREHWAILASMSLPGQGINPRHFACLSVSICKKRFRCRSLENPLCKMHRYHADVIGQPSRPRVLATRCFAQSGTSCRSRLRASTAKYQHNTSNQLQKLKWTPLAIKRVSKSRRQPLVCCLTYPILDNFLTQEVLPFVQL